MSTPKLFDTPPRHGQQIIYGMPIYVYGGGISTDFTMPRTGYWDAEQQLICSKDFRVPQPGAPLDKGACIPPYYTISAGDEKMPYCWIPVHKSASAVNLLIQLWVENEDKADDYKLEDTVGYEAHYDELKAYRENYEQQQQVAHLQKLHEKSEELGFGYILEAGPNLKLAEYVLKLETQLQKLTKRVEELGR